MKRKLAILLAVSMVMTPTCTWASVEIPAEPVIAEESAPAEEVIAESEPAAAAEQPRQLQIGETSFTYSYDEVFNYFQFTPTENGEYEVAVFSEGETIDKDILILDRPNYHDADLPELLYAGTTYYVQPYLNRLEDGQQFTIKVGKKGSLYAEEIREKLEALTIPTISLGETINLTLSASSDSDVIFYADEEIGFVKFTVPETGRYYIGMEDTDSFRYALVDQNYYQMDKPSADDGRVYFNATAGTTYYFGLAYEDRFDESHPSVRLSLSRDPQIASLAVTKQPARTTLYRHIDLRKITSVYDSRNWIPGLEVTATYDDGTTEVVDYARHTAKYGDELLCEFREADINSLPAAGTYTVYVTVEGREAVEAPVGEITVKNPDELPAAITDSGETAAVMTQYGDAYALLNTGAGSTYTVGCSHALASVRIYRYDAAEDTMKIENMIYSGEASTMTPNAMYFIRCYDAHLDSPLNLNSDVTITVWNRKSIASCTASLSKESVVYTGKAIKPTVTVKDGKKKLKKGTDYTVSYSDNKSAGLATVTISGKGSYAGYVLKNFEIRPKGTSISKLTAKSKGFKVTWKKQTKQMDGYVIEYSTSKKFKYESTSEIYVSSKKTSTTISGLKSKKTYYVRVRMYKGYQLSSAIVGVFSSWSKVKTIKTK